MEVSFLGIVIENAVWRMRIENQLVRRVHVCDLTATVKVVDAQRGVVVTTTVVHVAALVHAVESAKVNEMNDF